MGSAVIFADSPHAASEQKQNEVELSSYRDSDADVAPRGLATPQFGAKTTIFTGVGKIRG
jgi:hypothetical protein